MGFINRKRLGRSSPFPRRSPRKDPTRHRLRLRHCRKFSNFEHQDKTLTFDVLHVVLQQFKVGDDHVHIYCNILVADQVSRGSLRGYVRNQQSPSVSHSVPNLHGLFLENRSDVFGFLGILKSVAKPHKRQSERGLVERYYWATLPATKFCRRFIGRRDKEVVDVRKISDKHRVHERKGEDRRYYR